MDDCFQYLISLSFDAIIIEGFGTAWQHASESGTHTFDAKWPYRVLSNASTKQSRP